MPLIHDTLLLNIENYHGILKINRVREKKSLRPTDCSILIQSEYSYIGYWRLDAVSSVKNGCTKAVDGQGIAKRTTF